MPSTLLPSRLGHVGVLVAFVAAALFVITDHVSTYALLYHFGEAVEEAHPVARHLMNAWGLVPYLLGSFLIYSFALPFPYIYALNGPRGGIRSLCVYLLVFLALTRFVATVNNFNIYWYSIHGG